MMNGLKSSPLFLPIKFPHWKIRINLRIYHITESNWRTCTKASMEECLPSQSNIWSGWSSLLNTIYWQAISDHPRVPSWPALGWFHRMVELMLCLMWCMTTEPWMKTESRTIYYYPIKTKSFTESPKQDFMDTSIYLMSITKCLMMYRKQCLKPPLACIMS